MSRLPRVTGREVVVAVLKAGFVLVRIRGSHHYLEYPQDARRFAVVPVQAGKVLKLKTLKTILKTSGLSVEDLRRLL